MLVMAKCTARAFDNATAREYLPGIEYEIDTESQLATLTVVPVAYDDNGNAVRSFRDAEGKLKTQRIPKPPYVFEFNRAVPLVDCDYACKKCGKTFDSLNALGTHTRTDHNAPMASEEPVSDEPLVVEKRGRKKGRTFTCKICSEVLPNLYRLRVHNKSHEQSAVQQEAEVATTA